MFRLETEIVYGPLFSRRLGRSLGVNVLPTSDKVCSFDCVYCHYGSTTIKTLTPHAVEFPSVEAVLDAVARELRAYPYVDYLTFSGNGEPTLHPDFPAIAAGARALRDDISPGVKIALFSNSTTACHPAIRDALAYLDAPILKLDAGDPVTLAGLNRPAPGVSLDSIITGLKQVPNMLIQSVLIEGSVSNVEEAAFEAWLKVINDLQPAHVQIYSTDYPVPDKGIKKVAYSTLKKLALEVERRAHTHTVAYGY